MPDRQHQDANVEAREARAEPLYLRPMPGGGYVRIEILGRHPSAASEEQLRGRVILERRHPAPATPDDEPVVVEEVEGPDANTVVAELFRIARDNAAIARRVLRRRAPVPRVDQE